jgi:CRP/FNR family transcriptional regulator, nitrogen oxide reductase regulator
LRIDRTIVKSLPLFARMTDEEIDQILSHATSSRVAQGETVFVQGTRPR